MSCVPAARSVDSGLVRGAAIAAIVYHGLLLLLAEIVVLFASTILPTLMSELGAELPSNFTTTDLTGILALVAVIFLVALGIPIGLSIWMLVAARRGRAGQVLAVLIVFSAFTAFPLLQTVGSIASSTSDFSSLLAFLPWLTILTLGWLGWARMRQSPAPMPVQQGYGRPFPALPPQPGSYGAPAQPYGWPANDSYDQGPYGDPYGQNAYNQSTGDAQPPVQGHEDSPYRGW